MLPLPAVNIKSKALKTSFYLKKKRLLVEINYNRIYYYTNV